MLTRHIFLQGVKRLVLLQFMMNFDLCWPFFLYGLVDYKEKNNKNEIVLMLVNPVE